MRGPRAASRQHRVLILNQYVIPDEAASGRYVFTVAQALAHAGMDVTMLAAEPSYQAGVDLGIKKDDKVRVIVKAIHVLLIKE